MDRRPKLLTALLVSLSFAPLTVSLANPPAPSAWPEARGEAPNAAPNPAQDPAPDPAQGSGDVSALIGAGEAQLAEGKTEEAIATLQSAVAADPKSTLAHTRLGGARLMHQEYSAAIQDFRNALAADPNNADAFVGMAVAYLHSGDYPLARAALGEAKRLAPAKAAEIDQVMSYLDRRESGEGPPETPTAASPGH